MGKEQPQDGSGTTTSDDDDLRCIACDYPITCRVYRIEVAGGHQHTFVNPGGFSYTIGCFAAAGGCVHVGDPSPAFSWFPGYSWQIAICGRCRAHVGWVYRCAPEQFHGLILAALRGA